MLALLEPVKVGVPNEDKVIWHPAVVIGRTIECQPRYDVRLESGEYLSGIPDAFVERREAA
jgi:hypothetical protein